MTRKKSHPPRELLPGMLGKPARQILGASLEAYLAKQLGLVELIGIVYLA